MNGITVHAYSKAKHGTVKLSENFKVREFACKDGSDTIFIADKLPMVCQYIRMRVGKAITINSAYRTPEHNEKEGGEEFSMHLYGAAADIQVKGVAPSEVAAFAETLLPDSGGIGIYPTFTHVDVREVRSRWKG